MQENDVTGAESTRRRILAAAARLVQREGVARLTIEAVAREAGVSKGGVLYHFASKDALVEGMVGALIERFESYLARALADEPPGPGRWTRAYIRASDDPQWAGDTTANALIAAVATNPRLLEPIQRRYEEWQRQVERDGLPPALGAIIRLALDGLWVADLFGLAPPAGALRAEVMATLLRLARGGGTELAGAADTVGSEG